MSKRLEHTLHQRGMYAWIASKHMKRCSTSVAIREKQMKTLMRYYYTLTDGKNKKY